MMTDEESDDGLEELLRMRRVMTDEKNDYG